MLSIYFSAIHLGLHGHVGVVHPDAVWQHRALKSVIESRQTGCEEDTHTCHMSRALQTYLEHGAYTLLHLGGHDLLCKKGDDSRCCIGIMSPVNHVLHLAALLRLEQEYPTTVLHLGTRVGLAASGHKEPAVQVVLQSLQSVHASDGTDVGHIGYQLTQPLIALVLVVQDVRGGLHSLCTGSVESVGERRSW